MKQQQKLDVKRHLLFVKLQKFKTLFLAFCLALTKSKKIPNLNERQVTRAKRAGDEPILAHKIVVMYSFPGDVYLTHGSFC